MAKPAEDRVAGEFDPAGRLIEPCRIRDDLLYRLNVVEFTLPPLRLRSDRVDLANHLLAFFSRQTGRKLDGFSAEARAAISSYAWPGNLRELRNAIERAVLFATKREIEPGPARML